MKKPDKIERSLQLLNRKLPYKFSEEQIYSVANTRLGWYGRATGNVVNFLLNADILAINKRERPGLANPLEYKVVELPYKCSAVYENRTYGTMRGARIFILPLLYYLINLKCWPG